MAANSFKGHISLFSANAMWGLMSPVAKLVLVGGTISPLVMTDLRIFGAMLLFWGISFFTKREHVPHKDLAKLFWASLFAIIFNQGLFIFGVELTSPGNASIITTSMPLWAMVLAALFFGDPITGKKVIGIALGAGGAMLLILSSEVGASSGNAHGNIWGDLLVLFAEFCFAIYIVFFKGLVSKYSLITVMKWLFTFSFICMVPFSYTSLSATQWQNLTMSDIESIIFIVVGGTFFSYLLLVIGQKAVGPTIAGMYNYVQPVIACFVAVTWGLDSFSIIKAFAILMIFCGVFMVSTSRTKEQIAAYKAKLAAQQSKENK